jgi:short-subunit dehydrogenase
MLLQAQPPEFVQNAAPVEIAGARALLTGATGGIGHAIARALHERGAELVLTGRRAEVLESLAGELGDRAEVIPSDLSNREAVHDLVERAGRIDVLVANAALPGSGDVVDYAPEEIDRAIDVNLRAPMQLARALAPAMIERGSGHLVFVSSMSGKVALAGGAIYSATKFGLRAFAFALRDDLHGSGVSTTTIFPGFIKDAGMFADTGIKLPPGLGMRSPEQVAAAVVKGIERGRAEIDVAPLSVRSGGWIWPLAPRFAALLARIGGGRRVAKAMGEAQSGKR